MIHILVSIYDKAADAYSKPAAMPAKGVAIRAFSDEINRADPNNALYNHPDDYELYVLGEWEDSTGEFKILNKPTRLTTGQDVKSTQ